MRRLFLITCFILGSMNFSFAQVSDIIIKPSNRDPKENEVVTLKLESGKYNLDTSQIIWYINGVEADQGIGRKVLSTTLNNQNPSQIITVKVSEDGLRDGQAQIALEISGNILLFEGFESSVPLFYKGRSLPSREGSANIVFLTFKNDELVNTSSQQDDEIYKWKINGVDSPELSGINRMQNLIKTSVADARIQAEIFKQGEVSGQLAKLTIPLVEPEVLLYREGEGGVTKTLVKETESGKRINIFVEPFYYSSLNKYSKDLKYSWKINGTESNIVNPWYVNFSGNRAERVLLELNIKNLRKLVQTTNRAFNYRVE